MVLCSVFCCRGGGRRCGFFFFSSRRRHTRWPRDWSSDVCSSDLPPLYRGSLQAVFGLVAGTRAAQIGRASCRERVEISVVAVSLKKKKEKEERQIGCDVACLVWGDCVGMGGASY